MKVRIDKDTAYWVAFSIILLASFFISYYGVLIYHYYIPPGDDIYVHLSNTHLIVEKGLSNSGVQYPPLLYLIAIATSKLFGLTLIESFTWLSPSLLPVAGVMVWLLAVRVYGKTVGLVSLFLFSLVSLQPLQTYYDGSLPNVLAASVILPLLLYGVVGVSTKGRGLRDVIVLVFAISALFATHHLTVIVFVVTVTAWVSVLLILGLQKRYKALGLFVGFLASALLIAGSVVAFWYVPVFFYARGAAQAFVSFKPSYPFFYPVQAFRNLPWNSWEFGESLSGLIYQFSIAGILVLSISKSARKNVSISGSLLITIWCLVYLVGALSAWSGEPTRLARDFAMPASILAAWFIVWFGSTLKNKSIALFLIFVLCVSVISLDGMYRKTRINVSTNSMVRFYNADKEAYRYLLSHPEVSTKTTVMAKDLSWLTIPNVEGNLSKTFLIREEIEYNPSLPGECFMSGWYNYGIYPVIHADRTRTETFLNSPDLEIKAEFSDKYKVWYLMCKK